MLGYGLHRLSPGCSFKPAPPVEKQPSKMSRARKNNSLSIRTLVRSFTVRPGRPKGWSKSRIGRGPPGMKREALQLLHGAPPRAPSAQPLQLTARRTLNRVSSMTSPPALTTGSMLRTKTSRPHALPSVSSQSCTSPLRRLPLKRWMTTQHGLSPARGRGTRTREGRSAGFFADRM